MAYKLTKQKFYPSNYSRRQTGDLGILGIALGDLPVAVNVRTVAMMPDSIEGEYVTSTSHSLPQAKQHAYIILKVVRKRRTFSPNFKTQLVSSTTRCTVPSRFGAKRGKSKAFRFNLISAV